MNSFVLGALGQARLPYMLVYPLAPALVVVQSLSRVLLFLTPVDCSMPGFPVLHSLPEFAQTHVHE